MGSACASRPRRDGADFGLRHELHADTGARIHRLEVVDQLGQVSMSRRRCGGGEMSCAGLRVAQASDEARDLMQQLPAFAGLEPCAILTPSPSARFR